MLFEIFDVAGPWTGPWCPAAAAILVLLDAGNHLTVTLPEPPTSLPADREQSRTVGCGVFQRLKITEQFL